MNLCPVCNTEFTQKRPTKKYCSDKCRHKHKSIQHKLICNNTCVTCGKPTSNPKFCSLSCVSKHTKNYEKQKNFLIKYNNNRPKKTYYCKGCNNVLQIGWTAQANRKYCTDCLKNNSINRNYVDWSKITIKQYRDKSKNNYQFNARVRSLARQKIKITPCINCGYSKHVQVCHIKPVAEFDDNATIAQVNDISNLVCLCPNCHWEFDHNLIKVAPPYTAYG